MVIFQIYSEGGTNKGISKKFQEISKWRSLLGKNFRNKAALGCLTGFRC